MRPISKLTKTNNIGSKEKVLPFHNVASSYQHLIENLNHELKLKDPQVNSQSKISFPKNQNQNLSKQNFLKHHLYNNHSFYVVKKTTTKQKSNINVGNSFEFINNKKSNTSNKIKNYGHNEHNTLYKSRDFSPLFRDAYSHLKCKGNSGSYMKHTGKSRKDSSLGKNTNESSASQYNPSLTETEKQNNVSQNAGNGNQNNIGTLPNKKVKKVKGMNQGRKTFINRIQYNHLELHDTPSTDALNLHCGNNNSNSNHNNNGNGSNNNNNSNNNNYKTSTSFIKKQNKAKSPKLNMHNNLDLHSTFNMLISKKMGKSNKTLTKPKFSLSKGKKSPPSINLPQTINHIEDPHKKKQTQIQIQTQQYKGLSHNLSDSLKPPNGGSSNTKTEINNNNNSTSETTNELKSVNSFKDLNIHINTNININSPVNINTSNPPQKGPEIISINSIFNNQNIPISISNLNEQFQNYDKAKYSNKSIGYIRAYSANTYQGIIRNYNEDRVSIILNITQPPNYVGNWPQCSYFGIYDGHGGSTCADFLRDKLHNFIIKDPNFPLNPQQALIKGFEKAEKCFLQHYATKRDIVDNSLQLIDKSGSCSIVALIVENICYVANVGDSRGLISLNKGKDIRVLTTDHKPNEEHESIRIISNGGKLYQSKTPTKVIDQQNPSYSIENDIPNQILIGPYRVFPGRLSVSRTIGDAEAKFPELGGKENIIIAKPEITYFCIDNEIDFLILGCDGIFDQLSNEEVVDCVWMTCEDQILNEEMMIVSNGEYEAKNCHDQCRMGVDMIMKSSLMRKTLDNITVVMVAFHNFENEVNKRIESRNEYAIKIPIINDNDSYQFEHLATEPIDNTQHEKIKLNTGLKKDDVSKRKKVKTKLSPPPKSTSDILNKISYNKKIPNKKQDNNTNNNINTSNNNTNNNIASISSSNNINTNPINGGTNTNTKIRYYQKYAKAPK